MALTPPNILFLVRTDVLIEVGALEAVMIRKSVLFSLSSSTCPGFVGDVRDLSRPGQHEISNQQNSSTEFFSIIPNGDPKVVLITCTGQQGEDGKGISRPISSLAFDVRVLSGF